MFWLFNRLKIGEFYHHPKIVKIGGVLCYVSGTKSLGRDGKLDFLILISFSKPEQSLEYYKKRWQVESLFEAFTSLWLTIESGENQDYVLSGLS